MKCKVCGAECGNYQLCFKCNKLKESGKIIKCEKCGRYHYADKSCDMSVANGDNEKKEPSLIKKAATAIKYAVQSPASTESHCIICGKSAPKGVLCYECYKIKESEKSELVGRRTKQEAMDHYFNQRNCLYKIKNPTYIENGTIRLYAIAEEVNEYGDSYLLNRVVTDIKTLIEWKNKKVTSKENISKEKEISSVQTVHETNLPVTNHSFDDIDYRKQWVAEHQCDDGHYVRSYSELLIDNWLYNNGYRHAYEKSVFMESDPDAVVLSDFYIPDGNVYIEFWGLNDDQRYLERKKKKQKMYADNHLNLIDLEESDVKRLNDILPRKLFEYIKK